MTTRPSANSGEALQIAGVRDAIEELLDHMQLEARRMKEPSARALLAGTTELLQDLVSTYTRYETAKRDVVKRQPTLRRPARVLAFDARRQLSSARSS